MGSFAIYGESGPLMQVNVGVVVLVVQINTNAS